MKKFNSIYYKVLCESTDITSEQIVIDCIEDEIIGNGFQLIENWKMSISPIVLFIEEHLNEDESINTIPYLQLVDLITKALNEYNLFV